MQMKCSTYLVFVSEEKKKSSVFERLCVSLFISLLGSRRVTQRTRLKSTCTRGDLEVPLPPLLTCTDVIKLYDKDHD